MSTKEKQGFALRKQNLILMAIAFGLILLGFALMTGSTTIQVFNKDVFSTRRITIGPMTALFGFISMIFAILWKPKSKE